MVLDEKHNVQTQDFHPAAVSQPGSDDQLDRMKTQNDNMDDVELGPKATYINTGETAGLSQDHRDYLIARHGTLELDPVPDFGDQDPYNWPKWKVSPAQCRTSR